MDIVGQDLDEGLKEGGRHFPICLLTPRAPNDRAKRSVSSALRGARDGDRCRRALSTSSG